jgi:DNA-binding MarR family transcriptional regulator
VVSAVPLVLAACRRREVHEPSVRIRLSNHLAGILEHLDPVRPVSAGELARRLGVTPGTISLQLNRLIGLRLIARTRDAADRRRALLRLTAAGTRVRDARSLLDPACVQALLQRLPPAEREQAVTGIESLGRVAQTVTPRSSSPRRLPA